MDEIFEEIRLERAYQDRKWGGAGADDKRSEKDWQAWLLEYSQGIGPRTGGRDFRERMIKTAALAVAAIQAHDRLQS